MSTSRLNPRKKIGRPEVASDQVNLRMSLDMIAAVDGWAIQEGLVTDKGKTKRTEAIRRLVKLGLANTP